MTTDFDYKLADLSDIPALIELRVQFLLELRGEVAPESVEKLKAALRPCYEEMMNSGELVSVIATLESQTIAMGSLHLIRRPGNFINPGGREAYLLNMFTEPRYRGLGLAKNILNLLEKEALAMGYPMLELHATPMGEALYLKNNFTKHDEPKYRKWLLEDTVLNKSNENP